MAGPWGDSDCDGDDGDPDVDGESVGDGYGDGVQRGGWSMQGGDPVVT